MNQPSLSALMKVLKTRHSKDQPRHLRRFIHLDEVSSTWHKKQLRPWKAFMHASCDAFVQIRIAIAKNDSDGPSEFPKLRQQLCA